MLIASIVIYSTLNCPYCTNAKQLLEDRGDKYTVYYVDKEPGKLAEMVQKTNGSKTVPQIFINGKHIGGYDALKELHRSGRLDVLINN